MIDRQIKKKLRGHNWDSVEKFPKATFFKRYIRKNFEERGEFGAFCFFGVCEVAKFGNFEVLLSSQWIIATIEKLRKRIHLKRNFITFFTRLF